MGEEGEVGRAEWARKQLGKAEWARKQLERAEWARKQLGREAKVEGPIPCLHRKNDSLLRDL